MHIVLILSFTCTYSQPVVSYTSFQKTFEGKLNNKTKIIAEINYLNGSISGSFRWDSNTIAIKGYIDNNWNIVLHDTADNENYFSGTITDEIITGLFQYDTTNYSCYMINPEGNYGLSYNDLSVEIFLNVDGYYMKWIKDSTTITRKLNIKQKNNEIYLDTYPSDSLEVLFDYTGVLLWKNEYKEPKHKYYFNNIYDNYLHFKRKEEKYFISDKYVIFITKIEQQLYKEALKQKVKNKPLKKITDIRKVKRILRKKVELKNNYEINNITYNNERGDNDIFWGVMKINHTDGSIQVFDNLDEFPIFDAYFPTEKIVLTTRGHASDYCISMRSQNINPGNPNTFRTSPNKKYRINAVFDGQDCMMWSLDILNENKQYIKGADFKTYAYCYLDSSFWDKKNNFYFFDHGTSNYYHLSVMDFETYYYYYALTNKMLMEKDFSGAIKNLTYLLKKDPKESKLYYALGLCYQYMDSINFAEDSFKKSLKLDSNNIDLYYSLGTLYFNHAVNIHNKANDIPYNKQKEYDIEIKKSNAEFLKALPYFEKAYQLSLHQNHYLTEQLRSNLKAIYTRLTINDEDRIYNK